MHVTNAMALYRCSPMRLNSIASPFLIFQSPSSIALSSSCISWDPVGAVHSKTISSYRNARRCITSASARSKWRPTLCSSLYRPVVSDDYVTPDLGRLFKGLGEDFGWAQRRAYRSGGPSGSSPRSAYDAKMSLVYGLMAANIAVFLAWQYASLARNQSRSTDRNTWGTRQPERQKELVTPQSMYDNFTVKASDIPKGRYWTVLTSTISQIDLWHLIGNMFGLHAFGGMIAMSPYVNPRHFAYLAIGSGIAGSALYLYQQRRASKSTSWGRTEKPALGASGMVMGLGAAAAVFNPTQTILLNFFIPVPIWALVAGYAAFDGYYLNDERSRVGHAGHLGGAIFGLASALILRRMPGSRKLF